MIKHIEQKTLPYTPEQMFKLVAAIDDYPKFLPWCLGARINNREGNVLSADLIIGFKLFRESFTSRVELTPHERIDVHFTKGPFKRMVTHWRFAPAGEGRCRVDFHVEFEFYSRILQAAIGVLFHEAVRRMVAAFEARAAVLYGKSPALAEK